MQPHNASQPTRDHRPQQTDGSDCAREDELEGLDAGAGTPKAGLRAEPEDAPASPSLAIGIVRYLANDGDHGGGGDRDVVEGFNVRDASSCEGCLDVPGNERKAAGIMLRRKKTFVPGLVGCKCKTGCLKMYCKCFKSEALCTVACRCLDCANDGMPLLLGRSRPFDGGRHPGAKTAGVPLLKVTADADIGRIGGSLTPGREAGSASSIGGSWQTGVPSENQLQEEQAQDEEPLVALLQVEAMPAVDGVLAEPANHVMLVEDVNAGGQAVYQASCGTSRFESYHTVPAAIMPPIPAGLLPNAPVEAMPAVDGAL